MIGWNLRRTLPPLRPRALLVAGFLSGCAVGGISEQELARTKPPLASSVLAPQEPASPWVPIARTTPPTPVSFWEAEAPRATNFPTKNPFEPTSVEQALKLSRGAWLGADRSPEALFVEYAVTAAETAPHRLFARKFWKHCPFRWRFDRKPWQRVSTEVALLDEATLRPGLVANWVELGEAELRKGAHSLRLEIEAGTSGCAFDAFALTTTDFRPRGRLRPGEAYPRAPEGMHVFDPELDAFASTPLDLRSLNQERAGQEGFVTAKDGGFAFASSGRAVRFWGVNSGGDVLELSPQTQQRFARRLAKAGVNLLRLHTPVVQNGQLGRIDERTLANVHRLAATLSAEGIYLGLSIYFPMWFQLSDADGFPGYGSKPPFALHYFDSRLQSLQRAWWRALLTTPNPQTGTALNEDPSLAFVELVNEDSTLFWTLKLHDALPERESAELERRFASWLVTEYGSVSAVLARWQDEHMPTDAPDVPRLGILGLWNIANERTPRGRDTAAFLATLMREYYSGMHTYLRRDLGFRALTVCSNWHTADSRVLGPLDDWANSVCDVMDRHGYFSGAHEGEAAGYAVRAGQLYEDRSALRFALDRTPEEGGFTLPFLEPRVDGKPTMASELGWPWPNRFRAEAPVLIAAYAGLHDLDAPMLFATASPYGPSAFGKFEMGDPIVFGQFPATALVHRRNWVHAGEAVARATVPLQDLFALRGVPLGARAGLDPLRAADVPGLEGTSEGPLSPLALLAGPVDFTLGSGKEYVFQTALAPSLFDRERATFTSNTGELSLDARNGTLLIEAESVQGAVGFLSKRPLELPNLSISLENEYASVLLVPLDERPIASSALLLLQITTEGTNAGWSAPGSGLRKIEAEGDAPMWLTDVRGELQLKGLAMPEPAVTALDPNGTPTASTRGTRLQLLPDTQYYLVAAN